MKFEPVLLKIWYLNQQYLYFCELVEMHIQFIELESKGWGPGYSILTAFQVVHLNSEFWEPVSSGEKVR